MDIKLEVVVVPVSDVDRAKAFYADGCGFNVDVDDSPTPSFRIVQLTPPGQRLLGDDREGDRGRWSRAPSRASSCASPTSTPPTRCTRANGVPVTPIRHHDGSGFVDGKGGDWNSFFFFDDPDGNSWAVQESATMKAAAAAA